MRSDPVDVAFLARGRHGSFHEYLRDRRKLEIPGYQVIKSYPDLDKYVSEHELEMKELVVFGIPA